MLDAIEIPIEVGDRFSTVLEKFRRGIDDSARAAQTGSSNFETLDKRTAALGTDATKAGTACRTLANATAAAGTEAIATSAALAATSSALDDVGNGAGETGSLLDGLGAAAAGSASSLLASAGQYSAAGQGMADSLASGFMDTLGSLLSRGVDALNGVLSDAFSTISGSLGGLFSSLSSTVSSYLGSFLGSIAGSITSFFSSIFSKPSVDEYATSSASDLASRFGIALTAEFEQVIKSSAATIAAATGREMRRHMADAKWMPETISYIVGQMDDLGAAAQDRLAHTLEDSTKAVLINVMHLSEGEAASAMAGVFNQIIEGVAEGGHALSDEMLRMVEWARAAGAEIAIPTETLNSALLSLIEAGDVGGEKFNNLITLARQLGVSLEEAAQSGLADLRSQLDDLNSSVISMFERQLDFEQRQIDLKQSFVQEAMNELQAADETLTKQQARTQALEQYQAMQQQVADLFADDVVTLDEIKAATEGMTRAEKQKFTEMAKQRLEQRELQSQAREEEKLRKSQEKIIQSINSLVGVLSSGLSGAGENLDGFNETLASVAAPDLGLVSQLIEAKGLLRGFQSDLGNLSADVSYNPVSGQGGFDYLFRGPLSGYPVPVVLHGQERLTATPAGHSQSASSGVVFNVSVSGADARNAQAVADAFVDTVQRALDTKRLLVPSYSIDASRV